MKKKWYYYLNVALITQIAFSQNNPQWKGYFSYNNITDITQSNTEIIAASENALFAKNLNTNVIKTTNTIDGLSGLSISAIHYSEVLNKTIIGYENGLITVINQSDGVIAKVVDIEQKQLTTSSKKINDFKEFQGIIYISCDFGIVQFNLDTLRFGDTYFIGNSGAELKVNQTAVYNGFIYAATADGIRSAPITSKNLIDYNQWTTIASGFWNNLVAVGQNLVAGNAAGTLYKFDTVSNTFSNFYQLPTMSLDMKASQDRMIVTCVNGVYVFDKQLVFKKQVEASQTASSSYAFSCATIVENTLFIGTKENGLLTTNIEFTSELATISPSGPLLNDVFAIQATSTSLWAVYGDYNVIYNPYPLDSYGISKFSNSRWLNINYNEVLGAKSLVRILVNPNNEKEVFVGSSFSGLLKIVDDKPQFLYNTSNSSLEDNPLDAGLGIRVNGLAYDSAGNLWMGNEGMESPIKVLNKDQTWQSFSVKPIVSIPTQEVAYGRISIDKNGTKWVVTNREGVIGFNEKKNLLKKITVGSNEGNLPEGLVYAATPDNNNQLWIGTSRGLRVLSNVNSFLTDDKLTTKPIIILEDNVAQELMFDQFITDIVVDGANNKWIGTINSGVFLVSPNGQETKYHFTSNNSPLPSNAVNDIDINSATGEVFFATSKGLVSFQGSATAANKDLSNVFVFPNPVRPEYDGTVKISGLLNKAIVKITDIQGNLVYEATAEGGTIEWDTTAFGKYKVASGVYMIFISAEDGVETKVKKLLIVR